MRVTVTKDAARYLVKKGGTVYLCYLRHGTGPG